MGGPLSREMWRNLIVMDRNVSIFYPNNDRIIRTSGRTVTALAGITLFFFRSKSNLPTDRFVVPLSRTKGDKKSKYLSAAQSTTRLFTFYILNRALHSTPYQKAIVRNNGNCSWLFRHTHPKIIKIIKIYRNEGRE